MANTVVEALYGGGCEIIIEGEPKTSFVTIHVKVDETVPSNGNSFRGTMHADARDVRDLRDNLNRWLSEHGVK